MYKWNTVHNRVTPSSPSLLRSLRAHVCTGSVTRSEPSGCRSVGPFLPICQKRRSIRLFGLHFSSIHQREICSYLSLFCVICCYFVFKRGSHPRGSFSRLVCGFDVLETFGASSLGIPSHPFILNFQQRSPPSSMSAAAPGKRFAEPRYV